MKRTSICICAFLLCFLLPSVALCAEAPLPLTTKPPMDFSSVAEPRLPLADGGLLVTGYTRVAGLSGVGTVLIRLDASGDALWRPEYNRPDMAAFQSTVPLGQDGFVSLHMHHTEPRTYSLASLSARRGKSCRRNRWRPFPRTIIPLPNSTQPSKAF